MKAGRAALLFCCVVASAIPAEGRSLKPISPALDPESSQKFFRKDYPDDKRPGVGRLDFNHPYPVVQDSGDFDRDFVKDENSDNGHWAAQQEYDRLRHKLKKEQKEAAKALQKRREEEGDLEDVMKKYDQRVKDKEEALKKAEESAKKEADDKKAADKKAESSSWSWSWSWNWWPFSWPTWPKSEPVQPTTEEEPSGVRGATKDTEKAMDNLKDCEKQLAEAKAELKKVMAEAKADKQEQREADAALDRAVRKQVQAEKLSRGLHEKMTEEEKEHAVSEAAYLKQKEKVDKMRADLEVAKAKVKAFRDAEDKGGGVYNTPSTKSLSISSSAPSVAVLVLLVATSWRLA